MGLSCRVVAVGARGRAAGPHDNLPRSRRGIAMGGGGGGGTGPDALGFRVQPSNATAGNIITPAIQVLVRDSLGLPDSAFAGNITMSISVTPVGGRLSGTLSVAPVHGIALFGDLVIDASGAGYVLQATVPGATTASSTSFTIFSQYPDGPRRGRLPRGAARFVPGDLEGPIAPLAAHAGGGALELRPGATIGADGVARSPGRGEAGGLLRAPDGGPAQRPVRRELQLSARQRERLSSDVEHDLGGRQLQDAVPGALTKRALHVCLQTSPLKRRWHTHTLVRGARAVNPRAPPPRS